MTAYLNEEEKFQRMHEALAKILEQFERQGILRSEIRRESVDDRKWTFR